MDDYINLGPGDIASDLTEHERPGKTFTVTDTRSHAKVTGYRISDIYIE